MGNKTYRQKHIKLGLCTKCSAKVVVRGYCLKHYSKHLSYVRQYYARNREKRKRSVQLLQEKYKEEHKCKSCGIPLIEGEGVLCVNHAMRIPSMIGGRYETNH